MFGRPVASVRPGKLIMVSRPQSPNQGYPAITDWPSGTLASGRAKMKASAASARRAIHGGASDIAGLLATAVETMLRS